MGNLLWYAYLNQHNNFFFEVLKSNSNYNISERWNFVDRDWDRQVSLINGAMFVVNDLDFFIDDLSSRGFIVNKSPQSKRGLVTDMQGSLSLFDGGFR